MTTLDRAAAELIVIKVGSSSISGERRGQIEPLVDALAALHRKVDQALIRVGLAPEGRAYLPHITLARLSGGSTSVDQFMAANAGLTSAPFRVEHMILYESELGQGGSSYSPISRYLLA